MTLAKQNGLNSLSLKKTAHYKAYQLSPLANKYF